MACPSQEQLARIALGFEQTPHLASCPNCRAAVEEMRSLVRDLDEAHSRFEPGHAEARRRLLAILPTIHASHRHVALSQLSHWIEGLTMRQRFALSGTGILAAAALVLLWLGMTAKPAFALEKVAASIRRATSYQLSLSMEEVPVQEAGKPVGARGRVRHRAEITWQAPNSYVFDSKDPSFQDSLEILPSDRPGISLDRKIKTYVRVSPRRGHVSPLFVMEKLARYSGEADRQLGAKNIDGKQAIGFVIEAKKIDPDSYPGPVEIWVDSRSNLPVLVLYTMNTPDQKVMLREENFRWNQPIDPGLFDTTPPKGYTDATPKPPSLAEQVGHLTKALSNYAELSGGHYPRGKMVYGDVTRDEMVKLSGIAEYPPRTEEQRRDKKAALITEAGMGFAHLNMILRENPDAAYYGKTVGPKERDKVLLRWKLDDGTYAALFGDLHSETLSEARLREVEAK